MDYEYDDLAYCGEGYNPEAMRRRGAREESPQMLSGRDPALLIKQAREMLNLTQEALAQKSGIDRGNICKLETGVRAPSLGTLRKLADAMDFSLEIVLKPRGW